MHLVAFITVSSSGRMKQEQTIQFNGSLDSYKSTYMQQHIQVLHSSIVMRQEAALERTF